MQILLKLIIGVVILLGAFLIFFRKTESKSFKSDRPVKAHTYYYYPKANFYYDSTEGNYICWDSTNTEWQKTDKLPVQEVDLGKRVRIGETTDPVWKENQHHRLVYSVSLYSNPKDFKKKEKPVVVATAKTDSADVLEKDDKKSGVKKFFEKIFPPKKKKEK